MENKDKALPTAEQMIHEFCGPYGGFVNVITKCGGSLVMMVMCGAVKKYKSLHTADLEARLKEKDHDILRLRDLLSDSDSQLKTVLEENERLKKAAEGLVNLFKSLDHRGGLGYGVHVQIREALTNYQNLINK